MRKYIVTDAQGIAANGKRVSVGKVTHPVGAPNDVYTPVAKLCADSPLLAVLQGSSHPSSTGQRLFQIDQWEVSVTGDKPRAYTVIKELPAPQAIGLRQRLAFAILALAEVYREPPFLKWADQWLTGADRSASAAHQVELSTGGAVESADTLEVLQAHGELSQGDLQALTQTGDLATRVIAVTRAAQLAASDDPASQAEAAKLVAQATLGLSQAGKRLDLGAIAERAVKAMEGQ